MGKSLAVLADVPGGAPGAPNPTQAEVNYTRPNADKTRKSCMNCVLYESPPRTCVLHSTDVLVDPEDVCNYHVYGRPADGTKNEHREFMDPLDPEFSGLRKQTGGASCDKCAHYTPNGTQSGTCAAVTDVDEPDSPAVVEPLACCSRWAPQVDVE